jgi:site-specific recombinase XerC
MPSKKNHFKQSVYQVATHNRDGSYETQMQRKSNLMQMADQLHIGGFKLSHAKGLKRKHIVYLNEEWRKEGINMRTIANRNSFLRWLCGKIDKRNIVPSNKELGVIKQKREVNVSKAVELKDIDFSKVTNKNIYVQLHLQRYLGLRREESCKIKPHLADKGDYIHLEKSWCKGGRARDVPITTDEARYWLEEAKKLVATKNSSMIPPDKTYVQHRRKYNEQTKQAGDFKGHGLRYPNLNKIQTFFKST